MDVQKRRRKFMVEIKRQSKEDYFRSRREMLLHEDAPIEQEERVLYQLVKISLSHNGILREIRENHMIDFLRRCLKERDSVKSNYLMVICANALLDDLHLQQREALAEILLNVFITHGTMGSTAIKNVANSLQSLARTLPDIKEDLAADGEEEICKLILEIIQYVIGQPSNPDLSNDVQSVLRTMFCLVNSDCKYQLEHHFSRNILYYNALLQLHPLLYRQYQAEHCLMIREAMLRLFHDFSIIIDLNNYPLIFEAEAFINFILAELLAERPAHWGQLALSTLANLLIDYEQSNISMLMGVITRPHPRMEAVFRELLRNDCNVMERVKLLKILLGREAVFTHVADLFEEYWKDVVDQCVRVLANFEFSQTAKYAVQALMILVQLRKDDAALLHYLLNQGTESVLDHLMLLSGQAKRNSHEEQQSVLQIENGVSYLLDYMQKH